MPGKLCEQASIKLEIQRLAIALIRTKSVPSGRAFIPFAYIYEFPATLLIEALKRTVDIGKSLYH
jgi:hypothetical protein